MADRPARVSRSDCGFAPSAEPAVRSRGVRRSRSLRAAQRIDGQDAAGARHAGADFPVLALLVVAEKDVAMVDLAVDADDVDGAHAAFAAATVGNHLMAGFVEHAEH